MRILAFLLFAALATTAFAEPTDPPSLDLAPEFARVLTDYEKAWTAGDEEALAALFTADGWVLSNGRPPAHGTDAITERYKNSQGPLALRALHLEVDGDLAIMIGAFATVIVISAFIGNIQHYHIIIIVTLNLSSVSAQRTNMTSFSSPVC